ncbi:MAG: energy transducer TonB [Saprospiraceae bacterium]
MRKTAATIQALLLCLTLAAQYASDSIFTHVDQMPYFMGCEALRSGTEEKRKCADQEMVRFISRHLVYPDSAITMGIQGTVYVSFVVDEAGKVQRPNLLIDIGGGCGAAALDVIREMPDWEPGLRYGHPVKVKLNLPIQFFLKNVEKDVAEPYSLTWGDLKGQDATRQELLKNLENAVTVRGPKGDNRHIAELSFLYEKNGKTAVAKSHGEVNEELKKIARKAKKGGRFTISASTLDKGQFISVSRSFEIIQ